MEAQEAVTTFSERGVEASRWVDEVEVRDVVRGRLAAINFDERVVGARPLARQWCVSNRWESWLVLQAAQHFREGRITELATARSFSEWLVDWTQGCEKLLGF